MFWNENCIGKDWCHCDEIQWKTMTVIQFGCIVERKIATFRLTLNDKNVTMMDCCNILEIPKIHGS